MGRVRLAPSIAIVLLAWGSRAAAAPVPLRGRVLTRGTMSPVAGAVVTGAGGERTTTDGDGRFVLPLPEGDVELLVSAVDHEPLRVRQRLPAGGLAVEVLLPPLGDRARRYESTVRGSLHESERTSLRGDELRTLPGSLGDPMRGVALLPGVATPVTLLPIFVVRGAGPGMNGFFLDGMRVPQLFHLLVGGGVVQPRLVEHIDFYPGSYDATFGRFAGGIIDAETRPARRDGQHAEVQLRPWEAAATVELALPRNVGITLSGAYGWPGAFIGLLQHGTDVNYGDYQLRLDWRGLTVQALGAYDSIVLPEPDRRPPSAEFLLTFHRVQLRLRNRRGRVAYEAALVGGYDRLHALDGNAVEKLAIGWRARLSARWRRAQLEVGSDGELSRFRGSQLQHLDDPTARSLGELVGNRDGVTAGAHAALHVDLVPERLTAVLSARADVYHAADVTLIGIDPRLNLRWQLLPQLALRAGGGVYQQPPTFPVALPALDTFSLELGLQRAIHSSVAIEASLPLDFTFSLTGYFQWFHNVTESTLDLSNPRSCWPDPPEALSGRPAEDMRVVDGQAFGGELLVRRHFGGVTGWIAYTLQRSERFLPCGPRPSDFDQTHTLNVVVQSRLPRGFMLGVRLYVASGLPATRFDRTPLEDTPRNNWRAPTYVQLDLRLDREWLFRKWALSAFIEILNLTYSETALGVKYPYQGGIQRLDQPQVEGLRWVLPSLGLRGRL
jgi:hypothetical protein